MFQVLYLVFLFMAHLQCVGNEKKSQIVKRTLDKANKNFFALRHIKLDLLKNHPHVIPILVDWIYNEWHPYDTSLTKERLAISFEKYLSDHKIPIGFIALKDNQPVGVIALNWNKEPEFSDFPKKSVWPDSLQVVPKERGHGLGETLSEFVLTLAKRLGHKEVFFFTSNGKNVPWYVKRGAKIIETDRPFRGHYVTIFQADDSLISDKTK